MGKGTHPAWTPKGGKPDFEDYLERDPDRDIYFDLEYLRQTRDHQGDFYDDDWQLITAISAVFEKDGKLISLYEESDPPPVAIDQEGEIEVIEAFLLALLEHQKGLSGAPETDAPLLRMFNYSGSGVEGRLWKKVRILIDKGCNLIPDNQDSETLRSLLEYISETGSDEQSERSYGEGIERFDLGRVVRRSFEAFPLDKKSKYGLKIVERFVPSFSRPGSLVGSEDSVATWMRIKMLREEGARPEDVAQPLPGRWLAGLRKKKLAEALRKRRLGRELRRLEDSYLTYAEWDCRALYYLHKHLIALDRAAGPEPDALILGRRPTLARYGLFLSDAGTSGGGADPTPGRRATSARHGLVVGKSNTDQSAR